MLETLRNKVVLITGATGGLGAAVTRTFDQTGAQLALVSTSEEKLAHLTGELQHPSGGIFSFAGDLTRPQVVQTLVESVRSELGGLDVLLNTVGGWSGGDPVHETSLEGWKRMLELNLTSAFLLSRAVLPAMLDSGWGRILHVSSKTAVTPRAKEAGYAVAKRGLIALTEVIAAEVKGTGVTANVILPSIIDTPANRRFMPKADHERWVAPEEIAATLRFLCSDAAGSINGASIPVYGGV
jgi:NAD(P)-dependent dehydrogenase (short-subunit alcohol dehydrogenase family)